MKKYIVIIAVLFAFVSCEEENIVFDNENGQTGVSFATSAYNVSVPTEGLSLEVPVNVTTVSTTERSFNVTVDESTVGGAANYALGSVTIPAGEYSGTLNVSLNFDPLTEGEVYTLVVNLTAPEGGVAFDETLEVEYFKEIICNDIVVTVVTDTYGGETTWEITDADGTVVASDGPFANVSGGDTYTQEVFLEDGCYTFTIFDDYGDGQVDGTVTGNYTITCSILNVLDGGGAFGASEAKEFCINQ
ncbi:hypothetical protein [Maribacter hydrothermalis]|uniref:Calx-beta domain-containing protein n=1 Tax=Maribacter hydrothermalis TaxID=1836467 RepID=A0A1B7Z9K7_9FLAO|nr:hypothetical protein [Maribacter hydrothermalis]APQ16686.1 hypothetical protein BTR34_04805 [Maribacter hydrothermalis]OBR39401.1 hypothetical protein A9200_17500 [Maribacter hydrothermalis]